MTSVLSSFAISILRAGKSGFRFPVPRALYSTGYSKDDVKVVVADDGRTVVCWHPEPAFPYEHSLPLPEKAVKSYNAIKSLDEKDPFKGLSKEEHVRDKLMQMTYTTKHRWFPRRKILRKRDFGRDRPYL